MSVYSEDMNKTLDFISSKMATNPHLPEKRKWEVERKRMAFKDQVEMTLTLERQNSEPLNKVLNQINEAGKKYQGVATTRGLESDAAIHHSVKLKNMFMDCGDGVFCGDN